MIDIVVRFKKLLGSSNATGSEVPIDEILQCEPFNSGGDDASSITNVPNGNISATNVQAAINELDSEKQPKNANLDIWATKTPPSGDVVGTTDSQVLTNKTYDGLTLTSNSTGFSIAGGTTSKTFTLTGDSTLNGTFSGTSSGTNTGDQIAATLPNTPAGNISSTTAQGAINELDSEKAGLDLSNTFTEDQTIKNSTGDSVLSIIGNEASYAKLILAADDGDDLNDYWNIYSKPAPNSLAIGTTTEAFTFFPNGNLTITGIFSGTVANTPAGNISSSTVQNAINELDSEKQPLINFAGRKVIYISKGSDSTDTRTGLSNYDYAHPFATHSAAFAAAAAGDTVVCEPGTYDEKLPLKNGVDYIQLDGASIDYTGTDSVGVIDDSGGALTCDVIISSLSRTGSSTGKPLIKLSNASSSLGIYYHYLSNEMGKVFDISNGSHFIRGIGTYYTGNNNDGLADFSGGYHYVDFGDTAHAQSGDLLKVSGATVLFTSKELYASSGNAISVTGGTLTGKAQTVGATGISVNASVSDATVDFETQSLSGGITTSGTGHSAVCNIKAARSTGTISVGSSSTVTLSTNNQNASTHSCAGTLELVDSKLKITNSANAAIDVTSGGLSLRNTILVSGSSSASCITASAAQNILVYSAWSNKDVTDSDVTQLIGSVIFNSNVQ